MRTAVVFKAGLLCLAAAVAAAGLSIAATNTNRRVDLTLSGSHRVSERTLARLRALDVPVELVIAVSRARLDPRHADRADDVLAALDAASNNLKVTLIDVTGPRGPEQYERLIERLESRNAQGRSARASGFTKTIETARTLTGDLSAFDAAATSAAKADPANAARLGEFAAFARVALRQLNETLPGPDQAGPPDVRTIGAIAEFAESLVPQFEALQTKLGEMTAAPRARSLLNETARVAAILRARAGSLAESSPPPTDLDRAAGALATGEAALLIGPDRAGGTPGLVALDLDALYPPPGRPASGSEAVTDVRTEQVVASGLTVLTDSARPIVVFLHGEPQRWVGRAGVLTGMIERMKAAGIDHAEWPVVLDDNPPDLSALNPASARPVVFVVISPNTTAASNPGIPESTPGTDRAIKVGAAIARLIDAGKPVLINLNPSVFPTFGDTDPIAALVAPLGLDVRSAGPVLRVVGTAMGPNTSASSRIVPDSAGPDNPVAGALRGLPIALEWALPMVATPDSGARIEPLLTIDAGDAWSESEWLNYWRTPRAQRPLLRDPPAFDPGTDDARGPFAVAAAIETKTASDAPVRIVVVGSNTWFLDQSWRAQQNVAGRPVLTNPGNPELFDAAILWLAGQDELIAPSPGARPVARIGPVSPGLLSLLRWGLIGGMPLLILCAGAGWRWARG